MARKRDHLKMERLRRRAARLFEKGWPIAEVSRHLNVARQVGYRWHRAWQIGGTEALASKGPAGPKARIGGAQTQSIVDALLEGPAAYGYKTQLWTLPRVADLINDLTGVRYHPGHVWRVLGSLGFSCQRPERRAIERDDKAIRHWKRVTWPNIKKKRPGSTG
jgi:transposase